MIEYAAAPVHLSHFWCDLEQANPFAPKPLKRHEKEFVCNLQGYPYDGYSHIPVAIEGLSPDHARSISGARDLKHLILILSFLIMPVCCRRYFYPTIIL